MAAAKLPVATDCRGSQPVLRPSELVTRYRSFRVSHPWLVANPRGIRDAIRVNRGMLDMVEGGCAR
jgi:hypothetical protein